MNPTCILRCVLASLYEGLSVRWSIRRSVRRSVGPSVRNAFVKSGGMKDLQRRKYAETQGEDMPVGRIVGLWPSGPCFQCIHHILVTR